MQSDFQLNKTNELNHLDYVNYVNLCYQRQVAMNLNEKS